MSRPLRITYPEAIYHIINRGSRRDKIFRRIADREEFLSRLLAASQKYGIIVHSYCLMDNHFHLLVETPNEHLSEFMQLLQCGYANWFKVRHKLVGPIFQSRFKAVLVEDESYLVTLSAYIHLNPVRAKIVENPESYRWSSCGLYLREEKSELVNPVTVMKYTSGVDNYKYILADMTNDVPPSEAVYGKYSILGQESYREKLARQITESRTNLKGVTEGNAIMRLSPENIRKTVEKALGVSSDMLTAKTHGNTARKFYLYLLKRHSLLKITEIAGCVGMNPAATGELIRRFEKELKASNDLSETLHRLEGMLHEQ